MYPHIAQITQCTGDQTLLHATSTTHALDPSHPSLPRAREERGGVIFLLHLYDFSPLCSAAYLYWTHPTPPRASEERGTIPAAFEFCRDPFTPPLPLQTRSCSLLGARFLEQWNGSSRPCAEKEKAKKVLHIERTRCYHIKISNLRYHKVAVLQ